MKVAAQLKFSALAHEDLLEIARYIARNNPPRARSFVRELRQQCVVLSQQPGLGVARTDLTENLRVLPYQRYLIFFSEIDSGILVERVLHGARDLPTFFISSNEP